MYDSFYTPSDLAKHLINIVQKQNPKTVADFCVGDGELLRAAVDRWPGIECFGTDISKGSISVVKSLHSNWFLGRCDFLKQNSRNQCRILRKRIKRGFDLILLNPPFSCIGGLRYKVILDGKNYNVSTAMAFLVEAIKYRSQNGSIYAILPNSVAYSQKDREIWCTLVKNYGLSLLEEPTKNHFEGCSPNIILVSVNGISSSDISEEIKQLQIKNRYFSVFRGKVSMNEINSSTSNIGRFLIHSTNLRNNRLENLKIKVRINRSVITGPAVLIPRVGKPNVKKICTISRQDDYFLSDCVIAIKTQSHKDSIDLQSDLINNWKDFEWLYKGTGAKYITVEKLENFLKMKGYKQQLY
jgi:16S rRNA G966 N2-methylase RsmD